MKGLLAFCFGQVNSSLGANGVVHMSENDFLVDACVMMDALLSFRVRHQKAVEFLNKIYEMNGVIYIPSHAYFEYAVTTIIHFKNDNEKLINNDLAADLLPNLKIEVIPLNKEYNEKLLKVMSGSPIPDLKSADMIYFCIARLESLPLVTEDRKLQNQCINGGLIAHTIEEANIHLTKTSSGQK